MTSQALIERSHLSGADLHRLGATLRHLMAQCYGEGADQWLRGVLQHTRGLTEAHKAAIFVWSSNRKPISFGDKVGEAERLAYLSRFAAQDLARRRALKLDLEVWSIHDLWPREERLRSEFYRAFAIPFRLYDMISLSIRLPAGQAEVQLSLFQEQPAPAPVLEWRLSLLQGLLPAFRPALQAYLSGDDSLADLGSLIDVSGQALVLFDLSGRATRPNPVMRRLLAQEPEQTRLESAIREVAAAVLSALRSGRSPSRGHDSDGRRREIATSMAAYRLRGNPAGQNALGQPRAILVSVVRVAFRVPAADRLRTRYSLTPRELEVASLIMHRLSNSEIARMLGISPHTARHHTENVLAKLGVRSRTALRGLVAGGEVDPPA